MATSTAAPATSPAAGLSCRLSFPSFSNALTHGDYRSASVSVLGAAAAMGESPQRLLVNIEYPGFVQHTNKAIENMRGEENIKKALFTPESLLKLSYRPNDPHSHPLHGEVHREFLTKALPPPSTPAAAAAAAAGANANAATGASEHAYDFVIKVNKSRRRKDRAASLTASLVGQVCSSVSFGGLSDFQLLIPSAPEIDLDLPQLWPDGIRRGALSGTQSMPERFQPNKAGDVILAPLIFSRYDYPREYNFANHDNSNVAAQAADNVLSSMFNAAAKVGVLNKSVDSSVASIPKAATPSANLNGGTGAGESQKIAGERPPTTPAAALSARKKRAREDSLATPSIAAFLTPEKTRAAAAADTPTGPLTDDDDSLDDDDDDLEQEHAGDDALLGVAGDRSSFGPPGSSSKKTGAGNRKARRYFLQYYEKGMPDPKTPNGPEAGTEFASDAFQGRQTVKHLHRLFEERPIWSTDALVLRLDADAQIHTELTLSRQELLHLLVGVAYRFSGGPWRNLWIRYGYNPREKSESEQAKMYQVVDYRVNRRLFDLLVGDATSAASIPAALVGAIPPSTPSKDSTLAPSPSPSPSPIPVTPGQLPSDKLPSSHFTVAEIDISFARIPIRLHTSYQMVDLDPHILTLVRNSRVSPTCTKELGWLLSETMTAVRACLNAKMSGWCQDRGIPGHELATLLETEKRSKTKHKTLGKAFALERTKARGLLSVRKPRAPPKKKDAATPGGTPAASQPKTKKQKLSAVKANPTFGLSAQAIQAGSAAAAAAIKTARQRQEEEDDDEYDPDDE